MGKLKNMMIESQQMLDFGDTTPPVRKPTDTQRYIAHWIYFAERNRINPKTKRYDELQHAFLKGITAVLGEEMPVVLSICMASGRDIASLRERTQPR